jgi:glycosyltransferase involved in cell wall biosynthesis
VKILYLSADMGIPVLGGKGAAVHVRAMVTALRDRGHDVVVVTPQLTKSPWIAPAACDVPVLHVPASPSIADIATKLRAFADGLGAPRGVASDIRRVLYNQDLLARLRQQFEHDPPDVVYERASLFSTAGVTFAGEAGVPHLLELNAPLSDEQRRYREGGSLGALAELAEAWTLGHTDAVLAVSAPLAARVVAGGIPADRVHVVPNGVDTTQFTPGPPSAAVRARFGLGPGPIVGFVGGLRPWHGVEALPSLAASLGRTHPETQVVVVGEGPGRAAIAHHAERLGVQTRVRLLGAVPHADVPALIREFAVAVAPYADHRDTFYFSPLKVFEYLACGVPVVAADLGQLRDLVTDGVTGCVYRAGDDAALAAACGALLDEPAAAARMGRAGAELVARRYTWAHNAARVEALARGQRAVALEALA